MDRDPVEGEQRKEGSRVQLAAAAERSKEDELVAGFEAIVRNESARLLRTAHRMLGNSEDARDVVQQGLEKAYTNLHRWRGDGRMEAWVFRIVTNQALRVLRRRRLERRLGLSGFGRNSAHGVENITDGASPPDENLQKRQLVERLYRAMDRLSPRQRLLVTLRYFEQMSLQQISEFTGLRAGTIKTHLVRALRAMRHEIPSSMGGVS